MLVKAFYLLFFFSSLHASGGEELTRKEMQNNGITYTLAVKHSGAGVLVFEYEITNTGKEAWAVFNKGHYGESFKETAYCEMLSENDLEFSLKAFKEPKDRICPLRTVPILPNAQLLRAGEATQGQVVTMLPPRMHTPFDDCTPLPPFPEKASKARFCLGMSKLSDAERLKVAEGFVPITVVEKQQLLCTEPFDLPQH